MFSDGSRTRERGAALIEAIFLIIALMSLLIISYELAKMSRSRAQLANLSREASKGAMQMCHLVQADSDMQACVNSYLDSFLESARSIRDNFEVGVSIYRSSPTRLVASCSGAVTATVRSGPVCPSTYNSRFQIGTGNPAKRNVNAGSLLAVLTAQGSLVTGEVRSNYVGLGASLRGWFSLSNKPQEEDSVM